MSKKIKDFENYRIDDIKLKLCKAQFCPLDIMVTGVTGAGKSTTLNSFFEKNVAKVGDGVDPETMGLDSYNLNKVIRLWDSPGLGDGIEKDKVHKKNIMDLLYKTCTVEGSTYGYIDIVLVIIEGSNRDMGTTYTLLNEVIVPSVQKKRILVAINQADMAMKGKHWNASTNEPDAILLEFLDRQAISIQKRVEEATGVEIMKPIYYSAEYSYNIERLFDFIIDNMPKKKRKI